MAIIFYIKFVRLNISIINLKI